MSTVKKTMVQPINVIFRFLQSKARIQIWIVEQPHTRIEGRVLGFDEWMNVTLDDASEVNMKTGEKKTIGTICFFKKFCINHN